VFHNRAGWFRDFTCFSAFLVLFAALSESGYGQQANSGLPSGIQASSAPRKGDTPGTRPAGAERPAVTPPNAGTSFRRSEGVAGGYILPALTSPAAVPGATPRALVQPAVTSPLQGVTSQGVTTPGATTPSIPAWATALSNKLPNQVTPGATGSALQKSQKKPVRMQAPTGPITTIANPADGTDPYIVAEATTLNNDPNQIFAFVRDQVGFDIYSGSLRGARGTLWTMAGNALDRASLLIALLTAAGYTAQYVQGTLTSTQATQILQQIFGNTPLGVVGCLPSGTTPANPVANSTFLTTIEQHFWVQYAQGSGPFQNADPSFSTSTLGQVYGTPTTTFTTIPDSLKNTVYVELDAETYSQASALFGVSNALSTTPVITQTFATAELVGRPLALGHLVSSNTTSSLFSAQTNTYTPYLTYGNTTDPTQDETITGTPYQEFLTNFPLGSVVLTGVFLQFQVTDTSGNTETYSKTLFDRIGYAARQNGGTTQVSVPSSPTPAFTPVDITTINILASLQNASQVQSFGASATAIQSQLAPLVTQTANLSSSPTPAQNQALQQEQNLAELSTIVTGRLLVSSFANLSDQTDSATASASYVKAYFNSPRLITVTNTVNTGQSSTTITEELDLVKDDKYSIPLPGQNSATATIAYNFLRGVVESVNESSMSQGLAQNYTPQNGTTLVAAGSVADIFSAAQTQGIGTILLTPSESSLVGTLPISADAQARILTALDSNLLVFAPLAPVSLNALNTYGWYQIDPTTGITESVAEDGAHQGIVDYTAVILNGDEATLVALSPAFQFDLGFVYGIVQSLFIAVPVLFLKATLGKGAAFTNLLLNAFSELSSIIAAISATSPFFALGILAAFAVAETWLSVDPQAPGILTAIPVPSPGTPGGTPGVSAQMSLDPLLTLPFSGAQLPLVYRAQIQNTGPQADTFNLTPASVPSGFSVTTSLPSVTIPAGATAIIGVCVEPSNTSVAAGTPETFQLNVASATNSSVTSSAMETFAVPSIQGLSLSWSPSQASATPGSMVDATLTVQAVGNTAVSAPLTLTTPSSFTVAGVPSSVSLTAGQSQNIPVTITISSGAAVGTQNTVQVSSNLNQTNTTGTILPSASLQVTVTSQQAIPAITAAPFATAAGRTDIASTLSGLSGAVDSLVAACTSSTLAAFQNYANNLIEQIEYSSNSSFFGSIFPNGEYSLTQEIQNTTCSNYTQTLTDLNTVITSLGTLLSSPAAFPFSLGLAPSTVVAQPNSTTTVKIALQNESQVTETYNLSVSGIPTGLGGLNTSTVTLTAGQSVPAGNSSDPAVIISQTGNTLQAFSFTVTAAPTSLTTDTQSTIGTVTLRPSVIAVQDVVAQPGSVTAGGSVDVVTHIANVVNQATAIQASLKVLNSSNTQIASAGPVSATMTVTNLLTAVDFGQVTIPAGTPNGDYTLSVTLTDSMGNPLSGGTGTGYLLVGPLVSATLTVSPQTVPSGSNTTTVQNTLTVTSPSNFPTSLTLVGSAATNSTAETVALLQVSQTQTLAYVCDENEVTVMDVSNPASPTVLTTALSTYISNAANIHCSIQQRSGTNYLVIFADTDSTVEGNNPGFLVFDLSTPTNPTLVNAIPFPKRFVGDPVIYLGDTGFLYTDVFFSCCGVTGDTITGAGGDIVSVDLTNIATMGLMSLPILGTLSGQNSSTYGGPSPMMGAALYNSQLLYSASTTDIGNNFNGSGALDVINISNPSDLSLITQTLVSSNGIQQLIAPLIQGNLLVSRADTTGTAHEINVETDNQEYITVFDISDPQNPQLISTTPTNNFCCNGYGSAVLGPNLFLFGGVQNADGMAGMPVLELVNTSNPASPVITNISVPVAPNSFIVQGNYLYAPSPSGLAIYSVPGNQLSGQITGYSATVQTSNAGSVTYNPSSFNVTPTTITPGSGFDTLTWTNVTSTNTITWNSSVTGLQPAQLATVDQNGTVSFTSTLGNGTVDLAPVEVDGAQLLSLSPQSQTLQYQGSSSAVYTVTLSNPTAAAVTYNLSISGIPASWTTTNILYNYISQLPASANVPAGGTVSVPFTVIPDAWTTAGTYNFQVIASATGLYGTVQGTLVYTNQYPGSAPSGPGTPTSTINTSNVVIQVTPSSANAGSGDTAQFQVLVTNVGPLADTFNIEGETSYSGGTQLPALYGGIGTAPTIAPGQTFTGTLLVSVPANTAPQAVPINVTAYGENYGGNGSAPATVNIIANGVTVTAVNYNTFFAVNTTAQVTVTNTGTVSGTFALTLGGPGAAVSALQTQSVTLAAGASQNVNITIGNPAFATSGLLPLNVIATSQGNSAATATLALSIIVQSTYGVTAAFNPSSQSADAVFPLIVQNTGSVQDSYSAQITGTTGSIQASLVNLDGTSTQTIPQFYLPAQAKGQLYLNVAGTAPASVTVKITSQTNSSISATATALLCNGCVQAPLANAGTSQTVLAGTAVTLNGSGSSDPNTPPLPLTYSWTLVSAPAGSHVTTDSISNAASAIASFTPDVAGNYVFQLTVNNGTFSTSANVTVTATGSGVVTLAPTTVTLTSSLNPATSGQAVVFTAVVTSTQAGTPTGTIQFLDGATVLGAVALVNAHAAFSTTTLPAGSNSITAKYSGDSAFQASQASLTEIVNAAVSLTMKLTSSANPSTLGQTVTFTASFTASGGNPTGTVQFFDSTTLLGTVSVVNLQAVYSTATLAAGSHAIVAKYSGDSTFQPTQTSIGQVISTLTSTVTVTASASSVTLSQAVVFTAQVGPAPPAGFPAQTGQVSFEDNGGPLGSAALTSGTATLSVTTLTLGTHTITAVYTGDSDWGASHATVTVTVTPPELQLTNAAANLSMSFAPDEIVSMFNAIQLTGNTAATLPLGTTLDNTTVTVKDSAGGTRAALLYGVFASSEQINFVMPSGTALGTAAATVTIGTASTQSTQVTITNVAPGIFTAGMNGQGVFAGQIVYVHADGSHTVTDSFTVSGNMYTPTPVSFATATDQVYLQLYGTGFRHAGTVAVTVNGTTVQSVFAPQGTDPGLDQLNLELPDSLAGAGTVNIVVTADGQVANTVTTVIQ
jgi:large repetitive protein